MPAKLGGKHHFSVMSEDLVRKFRAEYVPYKNSCKKMADANNLKTSTVRDCVTGSTYANVKELCNAAQPLDRVKAEIKVKED